MTALNAAVLATKDQPLHLEVRSSFPISDRDIDIDPARELQRTCTVRSQGVPRVCFDLSIGNSEYILDPSQQPSISDLDPRRQSPVGAEAPVKPLWHRSIAPGPVTAFGPSHAFLFLTFDPETDDLTDGIAASVAHDPTGVTRYVLTGKDSDNQVDNEEIDVKDGHVTQALDHLPTVGQHLITSLLGLPSGVVRGSYTRPITTLLLARPPASEITDQPATAP